MQHWHVFAISEGVLRAASNGFQKLVGIAAHNLAMGCVSAIGIGCMQCIAGGVGLMSTSESWRKKLIPDVRSVLLMIMAGFCAAIFGTVLAIYTYTIGADIGVRTLIIQSSIIPGAIVGHLVWRDALGFRQWLGIGFFLLAAWSMLGFPLHLAFAPWVWLSLCIAASNAVTDVLARATSQRLNIWATNVWIGGSTVVFSAAAFGLLHSSYGQVALTKAFVYGTIVIGVIVAAMIAMRSLAYRFGGTTTLKKILMQGTLLTAALAVGIIFFDEPFTVGKCLGLLFWLVSLACVEYRR